MTEIIYRGNDHVLEISGLTNTDTEETVNDATVTVTLYDSEGEEVSGQSWPLTMAYVASSEGIYRGVLQDTLSLQVAAFYDAIVLVDAGSGLKGRWEMRLQAGVRRI